MSKKGKGVFLCVILLTLPALLVHSTLATGKNQTESVDPKVDRIIHDVSQYISGLESFSMEMVMSVKIETQGMKQDMTSSFSLALQRPDKIAMIMKEGMMGGSIVCDGKKVYTYNAMNKRYTEEEAPGSLKELAASPPAGMMGMDSLFKYITQDNLYDEFKSKVQTADYLGVDAENDTNYHHLKIHTDESVLDVWVQEGEKPLVYKIIPDLAKSLEKESAEMQEQMKNMKMEAEIVFSNWKVGVDLPEDTFKFSPPEGAEAAGPSGPHPLLEKPAPTFKLQLLDGGEFDLAEHKDKNIVILDFWATWCGPCKRVMPIMAEVAEEYKDQGVILIAVDLREKPEKIHAFLLEEGLHPTVALDADGEVGKLYEARSIPQTVIIAKDGTVQAVHIGAVPDLKEILKKDLDKLLAGIKLP